METVEDQQRTGTSGTSRTSRICLWSAPPKVQNMGSPSRKYRDPSEDTSSVGWFLFADGGIP